MGYIVNEIIFQTLQKYAFKKSNSSINYFSLECTLTSMKNTSTLPI